MRSVEMRVGRILAAALFLTRTCAFGQTPYRSPDGLFTVQVPDGSQTRKDENSGLITFHKGAVSASIAVIPQDKKNFLSVKNATDENESELKRQCPTYQLRQRGSTVLAGAKGEYTLSTCSDPKSPAVAECLAAMTKDNVLILFNIISPLARYYESIPVLDGIRDSLRLAGQEAVPKNQNGLSSAHAGDSEEMVALTKACAVGFFPGDECGRRMGMLLGEEAQEENGGAGHAKAPGDVYRDPQGRFTVMVPKGWTATAEGDNGVKGVQLRSGSSWINIIPYEGAKSASEVVLQIENKMAVASHSDKKPPFGALGLVQLFSNGVEVTFDRFAGSSAKGEAVEIFIAGIGNISGGGGQFLSMLSSVPQEQAAALGGVRLQVAQSVQLGK